MGSTEAAGQQPSKSAAAIVALVLGVVALATSFLPIINNLSFIIGLVGLIFSIVGVVGTLRGKRSGKPLAIASLVVNALALVIVLATQSAYSAAIDEAIVDTSDGTVASGTTAEDADANVSDGASDSAAKYTIADEGLVEENYLTYVKGTFTNTSGGDMAYVEVSYNLFDSDGAQIGTAYANTSNLADGATWKFEAMASQDKDEIAS